MDRRLMTTKYNKKRRGMLSFSVNRLKLTSDVAGTPVSSTTSRMILSNISWETFLLISESIKFLSWWWRSIPTSWGCQSPKYSTLSPNNPGIFFLQKGKRRVQKTYGCYSYC